MDDERSDDALRVADEALRALRAELSVAPSPDFQARVRAHIAQPRGHEPRWGWIVPALAAAASLIAAIVWMRAPRSERTPSVAVESPAPPPRTTESTPAPSAEPVRIARPAVVPRVAARPTLAPVPPLVPPGEERRIARYAASVQRWPYPADALPEPDPEALLADPAPIEVKDLETAPLVPDEGSDR